MVFGKKEICTAVAVLAAVLMAAAVLLAAPAWSQSAGREQGSTQLKPIPEAQTTQAQQQQEQQTAQASESLAGQETETFDRNGDEFVDLIIIPRECTVTEGASLVLEDDDGTQGTLIDNQNVQITQEANQLRVVSNPPGNRIMAFNIRGGDGTLDGGGLTVAATTGIRCEEEEEPQEEEPQEEQQQEEQQQEEQQQQEEGSQEEEQQEEQQQEEQQEEEADADDQNPVDQQGDVVDEVNTDDLPDTGGAPLAVSGAVLALVGLTQTGSLLL